jgi:hypothetical protein
VADYTATALVADMLRRGYVPSGSSTFTTPVLLGLMSDELRGYVVELLRESGGEHLVVPHTLSVTPGRTEYRLPPRAVANGVRKVAVVLDGLEVQLPQLHPSALDRGLQGYYLRGAHLVLWPAPLSAQTLRVDYLLRPSQLVSTGHVTVTAVAEVGTDTVLTLSAASPASVVDVVRASAPFDVLAVSAAGVPSGPGFTLTLPTASLIGTPEVGDYVCLPDESPVAQVPLELHALLAQRTAYAVLAAIGEAGAQATLQRCEDMREQCLRLLTPRDIGAREFVRSSFARRLGRVRR